MSSSTSTAGASARATLLVAFSACGFGAIAILVSLGMARGASLVMLLVGRYALGGAILAAMAARRGDIRRDRASARLLAVGGVGQVLISVVSMSALRYIPAATLSFLFYTYPAWIALIARFRHSETLTPPRLFALSLSLIGVFVMVGMPGAGSLHPAGVALALGAALFYAAYVPTLDQLQRTLPPMWTATLMSVGATVILVVAAMILGQFTLAMHRTAWIAIVVLALLSTVGAFLAFLAGLRVLGPVRTAIVSTIEPFFTALAAAWLLGQPLSRGTLAGGAFIAAAVILLQLWPAERKMSGHAAIPDPAGRRSPD